MKPVETAPGAELEPAEPEPQTAGAPRLRVDQLRGFRIGVTSDRRSGDLIAGFERRGAQVVHAPALRIAPHDQDAELIIETQALIADRPDLVLVTTGYGMRRWFEVADAAGLGHELSAVLDQARILARGPKALGAVRAAGFEADQLEPAADDAATTESLIDRIIDKQLLGHRVAVQQHGYTDDRQLDRLRAVSASVRTVTPYRWVAPTDNPRLTKLIDHVIDRQIDALTFTSAPAAEATLGAARATGRLDPLLEALRGDVVTAVVGPVTAAPLVEHQITPIVPDRYRLGALIRLVTEHLDTHRVRRLRRGDVDLEIRGRRVIVDGTDVTLGPSSLALFSALASTDGVVSRQELTAHLPDDLDDHALEVAVSRLRRTLGVPNLITTVVKRGYRLGP